MCLNNTWVVGLKILNIKLYNNTVIEHYNQLDKKKM